MPTNFLNIPVIKWGAAFTNALTFEFPLDDPTPPYSVPREGSNMVQIESGESDAWITGFDYYLEGTARWIPQTLTTGYSGWDGATGWNAFLEWASKQNPFRYYPLWSDVTYYTCYLVEPFGAIAQLEEINLTRKVRLKLRNISGPFVGY